MKNIFSLLIIGVAGFKIVQTFMNPEIATTFLGMEMNIWMYRLIWLAAGIISGLSILRKRDKDVR